MPENSTQENNIPKNSTTTKPKKKRDYKREYALRKEKGTVYQNVARLAISLPLEQNAAFEAKVATEPPDENGKRVTRNSLVRKWVNMYLAGKI